MKMGSGEVEYEITYTSGPTGWITEPVLKKSGDVYVFSAITEFKHADCWPMSHYGGDHVSIGASFYVENWFPVADKYQEPATANVLLYIDLAKNYSCWDWEFRYGPRLVFVPVWRILLQDEEIPLVLRSEASPKNQDGQW